MSKVDLKDMMNKIRNPVFSRRCEYCLQHNTQEIKALSRDPLIKEVLFVLCKNVYCHKWFVVKRYQSGVEKCLK